MQIKLPEYSSRSVLEERLGTAMTEGQGMSLPCLPRSKEQALILDHHRCIPSLLIACFIPVSIDMHCTRHLPDVNARTK